MRRLRTLIGVVVLALLLALAAVVAIMFATPPNPAAELDEQIEFPAMWTPTVPDDGVPWQGAEIHLEVGGAAQLINAPGGEIQQTDGTLCIARSEDLFTGAAEWDVRADGYIELTYEGGSLVLVSDSGKFGSLDWMDVSTPFCGNEPDATFGLRSALKSQAG